MEGYPGYDMTLNSRQECCCGKSNSRLSRGMVVSRQMVKYCTVSLNVELRHFRWMFTLYLPGNVHACKLLSQRIKLSTAGIARQVPNTIPAELPCWFLIYSLEISRILRNSSWNKRSSVNNVGIASQMTRLARKSWNITLTRTSGRRERWTRTSAVDTQVIASCLFWLNCTPDQQTSIKFCAGQATLIDYCAGLVTVIWTFIDF
jgi:hypothetical protein